MKFSNIKYIVLYRYVHIYCGIVIYIIYIIINVYMQLMLKQSLYGFRTEKVDAPKDSSGSDSNKFKALDYPVFKTFINE